MSQWYWQTLGIDATEDVRAVKRAYAKALKQNRPEDDAEQFGQLRQAYEIALQVAADLAHQSQQEVAESAESAESAAPAPAESAAPAAAQPEPAAAQPPSVPSAPSVPAAPAAPEHQPKPESSSPAPHAPPRLPQKPISYPPLIDWPPAAAVEPTPALASDLADRLWQELAALPPAEFPARLQQMLASDALFSLSVRDAFELRACAYCIEAPAQPLLINCLFETFDWQHNMAYIAKLDPALAEKANARHLFLRLQKLARTDPQLRRLLGDKMPGPSWNFWNRNTVNQLRQWIEVIHARYPSVPAHWLNLPVFHAFSDRVREKRYFEQTLGRSLLFGLPVGLFLAVLSSALGLRSEISGVSLFFLGEISSVVAVAWFTLKPPVQTLARLHHLRHGLLHKPLDVYRFDRRVHLAAAIGFALVSLSLGLPDLSLWQQNLQTVAFALCCIALFYVASADLSWLALLLAPAVGAVLPKMMHDPLNSPHSFASLMLFFTSLMLVLQRSPMLYLRWRDASGLNQARLIWLIQLGFWYMLGTDAPADVVLLRFQNPVMLLGGWAIAVQGLHLVDLRMQSHDNWLILLRTMFIAAFALAGMPEAQQHLIARYLSGLLLFLLAMSLLNLGASALRNRFKP